MINMLEKLEDNLDEVLYQLNETSSNQHARTNQHKQYEIFYLEKHGIKPLPASSVIPLIFNSVGDGDFDTSLIVITDILNRYNEITAEHKNIKINTPFGDYRRLILAHNMLKLHKIIGGGHDLFASINTVPFNSDIPIVIEFSNQQSEVISVQEIKYTMSHQPTFDRIAASFELLPLLLTIARPHGGCERRLLKLCIDDMKMTFYKEKVEWTRKIHFLEFKDDDDGYFEALLRIDCKQLTLDFLQVISLDKLVKLFLAITDENNIYSDNLDIVFHTLARLFLHVSKNEKVGSLLMMYELSKLILSGTVAIKPVQNDAVKFMKSWDGILGHCMVPEWWPYIYFINNNAYNQLMTAKEEADSIVYFLYAYFENRNIRFTKFHIPAKFSRWFKIPVDVRKEVDRVVTSDEVVNFLEDEAKRIFNFNIDKDSTVSAVLYRFKKIFN